MRYCLLILVNMIAFTVLPNGQSVYAGEAETSAYMEKIKGERAKLRQFMQAFPKGGDLHNHLSGAIYAETFLDWAAEDGLCVDKKAPLLGMDTSGECTDPGWATAQAVRADANERRRIINALSVRSFVPYAGWSGHDQFFVTFERSTSSPKRFSDMLVAVSDRAAAQNIQYLELMQTPILGDLIGMLAGVEISYNPVEGYKTLMSGPFGEAMPELLARARDARQKALSERLEKQQCDTPDARPGCAVEIRFIHQVVREFSPAVVYAQIILGWELMKDESGPVGLNLVAPEDGFIALRDYDDHMRMIDYLYKSQGGRNITLHAGELTLGLVRSKNLTFHIRNAIEIGHAKRIGHGVGIAYEENSRALLKEMERTRYYG